MRIAALILLLTITPLAWPADDFKVIKLEQDMRNLEQQVRELSRQLADVQRGAASREQPATPTQRALAPISSAWLDAKNWDRIRDGMSELDVINLLGPPTSMRTEADASSRTLFYAMEIGSSGFLGGHVKFAEHKVTEVEKPVLK